MGGLLSAVEPDQGQSPAEDMGGPGRRGLERGMGPIPLWGGHHSAGHLQSGLKVGSAGLYSLPALHRDPGSLGLLALWVASACGGERTSQGVTRGILCLLGGPSMMLA